MPRSKSQTNSPLIYNIFPRLVGSPDRWEPHFRRAVEMGFNWLYLNPVFYPGFSGSVYAVKDFNRMDPVLVGPGSHGHSLDQLATVLAQARALGLRPMVDLVINHTAKDSDLVEDHPDWFCRDENGVVQSPFAIDPADARNKTVWGDLAELDHLETCDAKGLKRFLEDIITRCIDLGFEGFRCDAAYKVPAATWKHLTTFARRRLPDALFMAETLGCRPEEMMALKKAGFDFVMNSSKYWAFDAPWCLDQHRDWQQIAPSVAFPETHDTPRLAAETGGLEQVQRQRFLFAAFFSQGVLVPVGYEFGFRKRIDVVNTRAEDWEEPLFDLRAFIGQVLALKKSRLALAAEGSLQALTPLDRPTLALEKTTAGDRVVMLINKDWHQAQTMSLEGLGKKSGKSSKVKLIRPSLGQFEPQDVSLTETVSLTPAEIALLLG